MGPPQARDDEGRQHSAGAIPTAERHSLWFKNSLRGPGLGKCCDAPKKEAMRCTAGAFFL
jgi:hypothetical protein